MCSYNTACPPAGEGVSTAGPLTGEGRTLLQGNQTLPTCLPAKTVAECGPQRPNLCLRHVTQLPSLGSWHPGQIAAREPGKCSFSFSSGLCSAGRWRRRVGPSLKLRDHGQECLSQGLDPSATLTSLRLLLPVLLAPACLHVHTHAHTHKVDFSHI